MQDYSPARSPKKQFLRTNSNQNRVFFNFVISKSPPYGSNLCDEIKMLHKITERREKGMSIVFLIKNYTLLIFFRHIFHFGFKPALLGIISEK